MRIDRIEIKNFRCFTDARIEFDPKLTVIVARNGQGKSAILDAVKIALWPYVAGFDLGSTTNDTTGIQIDDVRRQRVRSLEMDWRLPSMIDAYGYLDPIQALRHAIPDVEWGSSRLRGSVRKNSKTRSFAGPGYNSLEKCSKNQQAAIFSGQQDQPEELPVLAYFGTSRTWGSKKTTSASDIHNGESLSRTYAYRNCLDPTSGYQHFVTWFTHAFLAMRSAQIRNLEKKLAPDTALPADLTAPIDTVRRAIDSVIAIRTGWGQLSYSVELQELVLEHGEQGELKVSQLSDGIRNMLAMVGDIAYRCYKLNAHHGVNAAQFTAGIVLIDEIDLHLHPEWQQTVLIDLQAAFPRIQFIVTTHSPQVLTTVDARCIRQLESGSDFETGQQQTLVRTVTQQTQGVPSSDVMAEVMGVNPTPDVEAAHRLERYHELIAQGTHEGEEGITLRNWLDAHFGKQHALMLDCDRAIRFHAFKQKLPIRIDKDA